MWAPLILATTFLLSWDAAPALAATVTLEGTSFDSILDGFPGLAPLDGTPDFGGNALAVGFKAGATAERAFGEFPLDALDGVSPPSITRATLTFNVDDVLSTFGPGTDFDGTSSDPIGVYVYVGNGTVGLDDWGQGTFVASVPTGGLTDADLGASGPVSFDVDLTQAVRDLLLVSASHLGIELRTEDDPTGTSLDDLGVGGGGPPGVGGARLPFVTVEYAVATPAPTPTPTPAAPTPTPGAATPVPTGTAAATPTPGATPTPDPGPTGGATPSPAPTGGSVPTPTPVTAPTPMPGPTGAPTPSPAPTGGAVTPSPTAVPTAAPSTTPAPTPTGTKIQPPRGGPCAESDVGSGSGDQILAYFERGADRVTFLNVRNGGPDTLTVELAAYDEALVLASVQQRTIPPFGRIVLDLAPSETGASLPERGLAFVTAIDPLGQPIVTRALSGTTTVANLETGSAWGTPTIARRAIETGAATALEPELGASIDGVRVFFEQLQPTRLHLPAYYAVEGVAGASPATVVFVSFADVPGSMAVAEARETEWVVDARAGDGTALPVPSVSVDGVLVSPVEELVGESARQTGGSVRFDVGRVGAENRLIFFHQSLEGFGIGFALPPFEGGEE